MKNRKVPTPRARRIIRLLIVAGSALWILACGKASLDPVDIMTEDMCARCKMAISEKRYAAEFLTEDGMAYKFDDTACLVSAMKDRRGRGDIAVVYVVDHSTRQWLTADSAWFVRSPELKTPMGSGIVAFGDRAAADAAAAHYQGEILRFNDITP